MGLGDTDLSIKDANASARRMAAERAAVAGISTDALERGALADMIAAATEVEATLREGFTAFHRGGDPVNAAAAGRLADRLRDAIMGLAR